MIRLCRPAGLAIGVLAGLLLATSPALAGPSRASLTAATPGTGSVARTPGSSSAAETLGAAAATTGRYVGVAVVASKLDDPVYAEIVHREFTSVTPESAMVWDAVHYEPDRYTFDQADRVVEHARATGRRIRGQPLVWPFAPHPTWLLDLSTEQFRAVVHDHVTTVVGRYQGQVASWDVVSEAFQDGTGGLRPWLFRTRLGDAYIEEAFVSARAADPDAKLCYNDYNIDDLADAKTQAVYEMVKDFKARGVPIDCVGMSGHFSVEHPVPDNYQRTIERFVELGVDVEITELDVAQPGAGQADSYGRVVRACVAVARCTGITVWGVRDSDSWRAPQEPLLFDRDGEPKAAYFAVLSAFTGTPPP